MPRYTARRLQIRNLHRLYVSLDFESASFSMNLGFPLTKIGLLYYDHLLLPTTVPKWVDRVGGHNGPWAFFRSVFEQEVQSKNNPYFVESKAEER